MKHIIYLLLFVSVNTALLAQPTKSIRTYIRAGVGASRAVGPHMYGATTLYIPVTSKDGAIPDLIGGNLWLVTASAGVGIKLSVGEYFVIQGEVNVEQKGSSGKVAKVDYGYPYTICDPGPCNVSSVRASGQVSSRTTYVTVPLLLGYRVGEMTLSIGPYVGYKINEKFYGSATYNLGTLTEVTPVSVTFERYKKLDVGVMAAIAYAVSSRLSIDLRCSQGLYYVAQSRYYSYQNAESFFNQSVQLGVTYALTRNPQ